MNLPLRLETGQTFMVIFRVDYITFTGFVDTGLTLYSDIISTHEAVEIGRFRGVGAQLCCHGIFYIIITVAFQIATRADISALVFIKTKEE